MWLALLGVYRWLAKHTGWVVAVVSLAVDAMAYIAVSCHGW